MLPILSPPTTVILRFTLLDVIMFFLFFFCAGHQKWSLAYAGQVLDPLATCPTFFFFFKPDLM
jgi:hypothetical protein